MTRKRPKRGPGGRFVAKSTVTHRKPSPARSPAETAVAPPLPPPIKECDIAYDPRGPFVARLFERQDRRRCEECGEELTYTWMHVGRAVYHVGRCMRCCPEPPALVRE